MKSYDLGYIHSIPGRFYTGMKTMGESSARKRFMQTLYIANLQPFKTLTAAQLPSCFDMSAKLKNWGKVYGYDPKTNSQITDIWWTEQMPWCAKKYNRPMYVICFLRSICEENSKKTSVHISWKCFDNQAKIMKNVDEKVRTLTN